MSYRTKRRYTSRQDRRKDVKRKTKVTLIFIAIGVFVLIIRGRRRIWDWLQLYF